MVFAVVSELSCRENVLVAHVIERLGELESQVGRSSSPTLGPLDVERSWIF